ncbi:hypothetical protein H0H87_006213 [Tephrocybe sp. NHM501043]|nr:hypothetical protein H0H87_006213 [Tephrocybe sp. NHM501043]
MRVAVVGSGVSGLAATWLLNEHSDHTVDLYEADSRPGGHAHTVKYSPKGQGGESVDVDTGFIVFNPNTYPNFLRFLRLNKRMADLILPSEMTFSVSRDGGTFEWAGKNLFTVFCQSKNLFDPAVWRLLWDVARFNATAGRILLQDDQTSLSIDGMNDLQHIPESKYGPVLVTLNPPFEPQGGLTAGRWKYDHPVLNHNVSSSPIHFVAPINNLPQAVRAQQQMPLIQGVDGVSFAGAYLRYGFHEDGFTSGLAAVAALSSGDGNSVRPPFPIEYAMKDVRRSPGVELLAAMFEWIEASGLRALVGMASGAFLALLRLVLL